MSNDSTNRLDTFREQRSEMNEKIMDLDHLGIKRFFNLDSNTYKDGACHRRLKSCLGWLLPPFCVAMTASTITWNNVRKQVLPKRKSLKH